MRGKISFTGHWRPIIPPLVSEPLCPFIFRFCLSWRARPKERRRRKKKKKKKQLSLNQPHEKSKTKSKLKLAGVRQF